jgi:hypothetical protein
VRAHDPKDGNELYLSSEKERGPAWDELKQARVSEEDRAGEQEP